MRLANLTMWELPKITYFLVLLLLAGPITPVDSKPIQICDIPWALVAKHHAEGILISNITQESESLVQEQKSLSLKPPESIKPMLPSAKDDISDPEDEVVQST